MQIKKAHFREPSFTLVVRVPRTGIEPALPFENKILSLARLPIPPSGQSFLRTSPRQLRDANIESLF